MKNIIHDWDDEPSDRDPEEHQDARSQTDATAESSCSRRSFRRAISRTSAKLIDLEMLLMPGGRERTADEFASLFARAGFELARIVPTESPLSVIEARIAHDPGPLIQHGHRNESTRNSEATHDRRPLYEAAVDRHRAGTRLDRDERQVGVQVSAQRNEPTPVIIRGVEGAPGKEVFIPVTVVGSTVLRVESARPLEIVAAQPVKIEADHPIPVETGSRTSAHPHGVGPAGHQTRRRARRVQTVTCSSVG